MKKIYLLLLLLCTSLLTGCSEKTVKTMNPDERQKLVQMFADEYKGNFSYVKKLDVYLLAEDNEYYDSEKLRVQLKNQYTYYSENGIFEIMCYYDKDAKKWRYQGYHSLELDKTLDILGEWEFSVYGGLAGVIGITSDIKHYVGYMDIKEIRNNQVLIAMRLNNGVTIDEQWYEMHKIEETQNARIPYAPEHLKIYHIITVPPEGQRRKNLKYTITITYDEILAHSEDYQEKSEMKRLSTYTENNKFNWH